VEIVNPVPESEIPGWARAMSTTFLEDPEGQRAATWVTSLGRDWGPERAWGARASGRWVATLRTEPRLLTVPRQNSQTADVRVDALTNVTVAATHRRRGLLRSMLAASLAAAKERGDPLSILIAAEWPIYGRFGYAPATSSATYALHTSRSGAVPPGDPSRVRQVDRDGFGDIAPSVFDVMRAQRAGHVDRGGAWWDRMLGRDGYAPADGLPTNWFVHDGENGPDGLVAWSADSQATLLPPFGVVNVWLLATAHDDAYRDLWAYLGGIDLVDEIRLGNRPVDEPVRWLLPDARRLVATQLVDMLWLRLLDIPAALSARRYALDGEVVLEVVDDATPPLAGGRFLLRASGDEVECAPTSRDADLVLDQKALASIYLGGFRLHERVIAGGVEENTPGALQRVELMFSTPLAPWNATWF
jgi:predicted acetyltransferase